MCHQRTIAKITIYDLFSSAFHTNLLFKTFCSLFKIFSFFLSPPKELFQRAILLSGSSLSNWALAEQPEFYTRSLARKVDCGLDARNFDSRNSLPQDSATPNSFNHPAGASFSPTAESADLFRSNRSANRTVNNQLSNSDERIFQCLRSRSSEQLRTASIRLTGAYYSPFYSLFGPQVDSLLIGDDQVQQLSFGRHANPNYLNHSNVHRKSNRYTVASSNHDLLIGFGSNAPRFRPALKQLLQSLSQQQSSTSGLHLFYLFLSDFVGHVAGLVRDGSLNDQNDFNEVSTLHIEQLLGLPSASTDHSSNLSSASNSNSNNPNGNNSNGNNSTNWLYTKQNDLLNVISPLLLDALVIKVFTFES